MYIVCELEPQEDYERKTKTTQIMQYGKNILSNVFL